MQLLPDCFRPDERTESTLRRVHDGLMVLPEDALPLVRVRFLRAVSMPTPRSGYELTKLGQEALDR